MNENTMTAAAPKCSWSIKALGIFLIVFFGLATLAGIYAFLFDYDPYATSRPRALLAIITNLGFAAGGVGLLGLRSWGLWLTVGLCGLRILNVLWQVFMTSTPGTATTPNENTAYVVTGFYLAIALFLTSRPSRKALKYKPAASA